MATSQPSWFKRHKILTGIMAFVAFIIIVGSLRDSSQETNLDVSQETSNYEATLLSTDHNSRVQNFEFLVKTNDLSEENLTTISTELKDQNCTQSCNVWLYDDEQAYTLQKEYDTIDIEWRNEVVNGNMTMDELNEKLESWDQENYTFLADHYLGFLSFDDNSFLMYPLKDKKYEELKS